MDQAKVIEFLNQTLLTDYISRLLNVKMTKLVLFPAFPITAAPNISEPKTFVMMKNPAKFIDFKKPDLN
ncbi:MAG: hypothetical protein WC624_01330 [Candidatus Margulisiibacteriota bacterium]